MQTKLHWSTIPSTNIEKTWCCYVENWVKYHIRHLLESNKLEIDQTGIIRNI